MGYSKGSSKGKFIAKNVFMEKSEGMVQWLTPLISAIWEAEIQKIMVLGQLRQKVSKIPSQQIKQAQWIVTIIPCKGEARIGGS
jgi:hypothetical protein